MKLTFGLLMIAMIPNFANAASGGNTKNAKAVLGNREIQALIRLEERAHGLKCEAPSEDEITFAASENSDAGVFDFDAMFGCNDKRGGANVQRIHITGFVYLSSPRAEKATAAVTGMQIESAE